MHQRKKQRTKSAVIAIEDVDVGEEDVDIWGEILADEADHIVSKAPSNRHKCKYFDVDAAKSLENCSVISNDEEGSTGLMCVEIAVLEDNVWSMSSNDMDQFLLKVPEWSIADQWIDKYKPKPEAEQGSCQRLSCMPPLPSRQETKLGSRSSPPLSSSQGLSVTSDSPSDRAVLLALPAQVSSPKSAASQNLR